MPIRNDQDVAREKHTTQDPEWTPAPDPNAILSETRAATRSTSQEPQQTGGPKAERAGRGKTSGGQSKTKTKSKTASKTTTKSRTTKKSK